MVTRKRKITIRDVALRAGVSYQTVSRVLNENDSVADETRRRVQEAMKDLEYVPNKIAQMLNTNQSMTLELLVVDIRQGGRFANSIRDMALVSGEAGYDLLVTMTDDEHLAEAFKKTAGRLVDGAIMYAPSLRISDEALLEMSQELPLVRRDFVPGSNLAWVGYDQVYATRMAVEYLIQLGHHQIACLPPTSALINGDLRQRVWRETLLGHGLTPGPMCSSLYNFRGGYEAMQQVLSTRQPFTAVLVGSDTMALGAMRALRERGLHIPADVSVMSFDNAEMAAFTEPSLTTVNFDFHLQDTLAIRSLIEMLNEPDVGLQQRILLPDLIIRESTRRLENGAP